MENNIVRDVYESLKSSTKEIGKVVLERDRLEEKIKSGRYTREALQSEIYPELDRLKARVRDGVTDALAAARGLVKQYEADIETLNDLDPAEITDDIKLLQAGVPLLPNDIKAILRRNSTNRTMTQLALRYAAEHGINTGGVFYIGGQQEAETAKNLYNLIDIYAKYIDKPDGVEMLNKFFSRVSTQE